MKILEKAMGFESWNKWEMIGLNAKLLSYMVGAEIFICHNNNNKSSLEHEKSKGNFTNADVAQSRG